MPRHTRTLLLAAHVCRLTRTHTAHAASLLYAAQRSPACHTASPTAYRLDGALIRTRRRTWRPFCCACLCATGVATSPHSAGASLSYRLAFHSPIGNRRASMARRHVHSSRRAWTVLDLQLTTTNKHGVKTSCKTGALRARRAYRALAIRSKAAVARLARTRARHLRR